MTRADVADLIDAGESSGVEFKRDDLRPERIAREIAALLNLEGGHILSPGRLPNTVTVEKMRAGYRATRNELVKEMLRDYRYVEATGLGVPRQIIRGMREHNGTDPDLIEEEDRFTVRLWKRPAQANAQATR